MAATPEELVALIAETKDALKKNTETMTTLKTELETTISGKIAEANQPIIDRFAKLEDHYNNLNTQLKSTRIGFL